MPPDLQISRPLPLDGRHIVVTRPAGQAGALCEQIEAAGGEAILFPLLEIAPLADADYAPLRKLAVCLADYRFVAFVSPNAVEFSLPILLENHAWPQGTQALTVGPGSAAALSGYGIDAWLPSGRFDSEALLEMPQLAADEMRGCRVLIVRGDGGRPLLGDVLRERGAKVDYVSVYRRSAPEGSAACLLDRWRRGALDAFVISSSEALQNLLNLLDAEAVGKESMGRVFLNRTPVFVPHARIADVAKKAGLEQLVLTGPADEGLFAGLCAYNWQ